jgi:hypothetical protein
MLCHFISVCVSFYALLERVAMILRIKIVDRPVSNLETYGLKKTKLILLFIGVKLDLLC